MSDGIVMLMSNGAPMMVRPEEVAAVTPCGERRLVTIRGLSISPLCDHTSEEAGVLLGWLPKVPTEPVDIRGDS